MTWTANLDSFKRATTGTDTIAQVTFSNGADAFTETITIDCMDAGTLSDAVADRLNAYKAQETGFNTLAVGPVTPGIGATERRLRNALVAARDLGKEKADIRAEIDRVLASTTPAPVVAMVSSPAAKAARVV